jgi:hypothetical protein
MAEKPSWLRAAARRFPDDARLIEEISARPGPLRDMCEELSDAEKALAATDMAPPEIRDARKNEWQSAIETLTREIKQALQEANVVRIGRGLSRSLKGSRAK